MVGLQAPSSSRIRHRPASSSSAAAAKTSTKTAAAASPHRSINCNPTRIVSSNSNSNNYNATTPTKPTQPTPQVPLESVVIRNNNNDTNASPQQRFNNSISNNNNINNPANSNHENEDSKIKSTSVKVCVRLRPKLPSDLKNSDNANANHTSASASAASLPSTSTTQSTPKGKGFARGTASSVQQATTPRKEMQTPSSKSKRRSGLATPSDSPTNGKKRALSEAAARGLSSHQQLQQHPSWSTHPSDTTRISQDKNAAAALQIQTPAVVGGVHLVAPTMMARAGISAVAMDDDFGSKAFHDSLLKTYKEKKEYKGVVIYANENSKNRVGAAKTMMSMTSINIGIVNGTGLNITEAAIAFDMIVLVLAKIHDLQSKKAKEKRLLAIWENPPPHILFKSEVPAEMLRLIMRLFGYNRNRHSPLNFSNPNLVKSAWKEEKKYRKIELTKMTPNRKKVIFYEVVNQILQKL